MVCLQEVRTARLLPLDLDDIKAEQADTSADAKKCNVQVNRTSRILKATSHMCLQTPRENATRGTVASSARTPAKPTPQQLPIPTATRKRVTAVVTNPSDTDARPPLKRQRRDLKDSQAAKVEDIHVQPLVSTPATVAVTQEQQIVSEAQSKPTKGQHALPVAAFTKVHVQKQSPGNIRYTSTPRAGRFEGPS